MMTRCAPPDRSSTTAEKIICLDIDRSALSCTGPLERPQGQPATASEAPLAQDWRLAREWVCMHGPQIETLVARMFEFAPDLQYVIDVAPDASPPSVSVTLWCTRAQLFRFDARLWMAGADWHALVTTRLGAGPVRSAADLRFSSGPSGEPDITPEAIVIAFRRSLRFALTREALPPAKQGSSL